MTNSAPLVTQMRRVTPPSRGPLHAPIAQEKNSPYLPMVLRLVMSHWNCGFPTVIPMVSLKHENTLDPRFWLRQAQYGRPAWPLVLLGLVMKCSQGRPHSRHVGGVCSGNKFSNMIDC